MKKRVLRLSILLILALILVLTISVPALAKPFGGKSDLYNAIDLGGARLLATQGPDSGTIPYNWEWVAGDGYFDNPNLQGATAIGLLAAYEKTGNRDYLNAAKNSGDVLKLRYAADPSHRPYTQDVEFLVRLAKDSRDKSYLDLAKVWYEVVTVDFTAEANADRYITLRGGSMAGWDVASQIRSAYATGFKDYARDMAKQMINRSADWVHVLSYGWDYTNLAYGSLLWALGEMGSPYQFRNTIKEYRDELLASQGEDGSWDDGDYQNTAYIVLGLEAVKGAGKDLRDAISSAVEFLLDEQTSDGGWAYPDDVDPEVYYEYPQVDAECVMALESIGEQEYNPPGHGDQHGQGGQHGQGDQHGHGGPNGNNHGQSSGHGPNK
jgi:hypothetical protein